MQFTHGNAIIGQSGGPTSAINATLAGVYRAARDNEYIQTIYGMVHGIEGLLKADVVDLATQIKSDHDVDVLAATPSAFLGSCRFKLPKLEDKPEVFEQIFDMFKKFEIKYFFYIGGNDSMDTVLKLSLYAKSINYDINIMGVPKTIDNDLAVTDHTPGFGSAAKYIATATREVSRDASVYPTPVVTIMEVMGRNAGWLTAATALARGENCDAPDLIYVPELMFDIDKFVMDVKKLSEKKRCIIVAVSEGVKVDKDTYVCEAISRGETDAFGHKHLSGTAKVLADIVNERLGLKTRQIEFGLLQRCASHCASATDISESLAVGAEAVKEAVNGSTGKMVYYIRESSSPYKMSIGCIDISKIANVEKTIPREWINEEGNNVKKEVIDYMLPLIQGEAPIFIKDGLPQHLVLKK